MEPTGAVLVAYATWGGGAQRIAEAIGDSLVAEGVTAHVRRAADVRDLAGYSAVIIGTPLQAGRLHGDVHAFVKAHESGLSARPFAVFAVCLTSKADTPENRRRAESALAELWRTRPDVRPVTTGLFCDAPRPDAAALQRLPFARRIRYKRMKPPSANYGDWDDLDAWIGEARDKLLKAGDRKAPSTRP
jgi:menaquinone-dependent protoporphyrinogen oxidase